jgi:hypothetical protein
VVQAACPFAVLWGGDTLTLTGPVGRNSLHTLLLSSHAFAMGDFTMRRDPVFAARALTNPAEA